MALVSQSIKNLKGGISQQPDILRYPEQGAVQVNGWSSETEGLQKRPPVVFSKNIGDSSVLGDAPLVHLINRDAAEQYYAVFTGSTIKVYDLAGNEKYVNIQSSYHKCPNPREQLRMVTVADYTFVVNRTVPVKKNTSSLSMGGTFRPDGDALINVRGGQYGRALKIILNDVEVAAYDIPDGKEVEHIKSTDAQFLCEELARQAREKLGAAGWQFMVGQGFIHIVAPANDRIRSLSTLDGYADQLINPVTHYVQSFSKLPLNAPDAYMVKIIGQAGSTGDQYYVQYDTKRKVWTECIGWNVAQEFMYDTMPHVLIRQADGSFVFRAHSWDRRTAGDDDTNPWPSFEGGTLNDVFFYRNRLGFLSGENIILSRTAKYFNFFPASVASLSDDDPIDVAVSFNRVSILKYAVPFAEELLLWSDESQFVLTAGGVLSSKTVELNLTTQFNVQDKARPFGIGRNIYFAAPRAAFTSINRYYAVQDVSAVKDAEDVTSHVPDYIPNGVYNIAGSPTESFASILTSGAPSRVYIYKFKYLDGNVQQQSWSHWEFGSDVTILAAHSIGSKMFILAKNQYSTFMGYVTFTKNTTDFDREPYRLFMDNKVSYQIPAGTYNDDVYETTIRLNAVYGTRFSLGTVSVVEEDGKINEFYPPEGGWQADDRLVLNGNLEGTNVFIGFNFPFRYEFSKFLIKKQADDGSISTEDTGRLQLRRAWVNYENSGEFTIQVDNQSRVFTYQMAGSKLGSTTLRAGALNVGTGQYRFPVVGNATTNTVRILSDSTTPLNVIGCGWEGNYSRRSSGI